MEKYVWKLYFLIYLINIMMLFGIFWDVLFGMVCVCNVWMIMLELYFEFIKDIYVFIS